VAAAGLVCGLLGLSLQLVLWTDSPAPVRIIIPLMYVGPAVAVACGLTGAAMLWYSFAGKLRMRERLLNRVPWRGDERVLAVVCGGGLLPLGTAPGQPTGRAGGIDLWQGAALPGNSPAATLANAEAAGVAGRVEVHPGDARQLPFPDADFDVVLSTA